MQIVSFEQGGKKYSLDMDDLDGNEMGIIGRLQAQMGNGVGIVYGVLIVAKRRAGENVSEKQVLALKWGDIQPVDVEADAGPPAVRAVSDVG